MSVLKKNALIVLSARREGELFRVSKAAGLTSSNSLIIPFDLSDTSQAKDYAQQIITKFGRIDILINKEIEIYEDWTRLY